MGKIDTETKKYLDNDARFSDLFNFWIYGGEEVIKPDKLRELDTTAIAIPYGNKAKKHVQKYRDLLKLYSAKQDDEAIYLILGVEIEAKTHYAMPVRNMLYDALNYTQQVSDIAEHNTKAHLHMTHDEFLSGLLESDRLRPVITLVFNVSGEPWKGATNVYDLLSVKDKRILQFVPNYQMNLLSPDLLNESDFDKFKTNLGAALQFIKHQKDDNMDWINNMKRLEHVDRATADFIQTATGTKFDIDDDDEVINVCRAWENSLNKAKTESEAKGKDSERLNSIRNVMKSLNVTVNRAMEILCIPADEQKKYISLL